MSLVSREDNYDNDDNSFCVCSAHMLATLVYSFELFPKAHLILIMRDNASYKMLLPRPLSLPLPVAAPPFYTLPLLTRLKTSSLGIPVQAQN